MLTHIKKLLHWRLFDFVLGDLVTIFFISRHFLEWLGINHQCMHCVCHIMRNLAHRYRACFVHNFHAIQPPLTLTGSQHHLASVSAKIKARNFTVEWILWLFLTFYLFEWNLSRHESYNVADLWVWWEFQSETFSQIWFSLSQIDSAASVHYRAPD